MMRALPGPGLGDTEWQGTIHHTVLRAVSQDECVVSAEGSSACRSHTGAGIPAQNSSAKRNLGLTFLCQEEFSRSIMVSEPVHAQATLLFHGKVRSWSKAGLDRGRAELCPCGGSR